MDDAHDPCGHEKYVMGGNTRDPQEAIKTLQCWICGGPHLHRICPHGEGYVWPAYNSQGHGNEAIGKREQESSLDVAATIIILRAELQDCK